MPKANVNNLEIFYSIEGSGEPLLILGGLGDSNRNWNLTAKQLAKNFQVIVIDHRGAGQSERVTSPYQIEDFAEDAANLLDTLGIKTTHVLGFSMGGKVALTFATKHPDRVNKLIMVSTGLNKDLDVNLRSHAREVMDRYKFTPESFEAQFEMLFGKKFKAQMGANMFVKFQLNNPHPQSEQDFRLQFEAVKSFKCPKNFSNLTMPTLILHGEDDQVTPVENAIWLESQLSNGTLITYPEVGHIPQAEASGQFIKDVNSFLLS